MPCACTGCRVLHVTRWKKLNPLDHVDNQPTVANVHYPTFPFSNFHNNNECQLMCAQAQAHGMFSCAWQCKSYSSTAVSQDV
jgi:hypothetical protein